MRKSLDTLVTTSHPLRVRGLKSDCRLDDRGLLMVAPLAGAWIEMYLRCEFVPIQGVAPLAGAWIEILEDVPLYIP